MLHSLPTESKLFYCVYYSLLELMGDEKADDIFNTAGLDPFDDKAPVHYKHGSALLEKVAMELYGHFGEDTTRGLLIRMGNASLTFFRKYFPDIAQLGSIENRLKPSERRFLTSLDTLAKVLSREMGVSFEAIVRNPRIFDWQSKKSNCESHLTSLSTFFYFGLLEEFCSWLDSRKNYLLSFTAGEEFQDKDVITIEIKDLD